MTRRATLATAQRRRLPRHPHLLGHPQEPADDYIRAMFGAQGVDPADRIVDDTLRVRADRRQLLTRDNAARFGFVLSESALRRRIGTPAVMAEQLRHLAEVAKLPNVTLQIIPFDARSYAHLSTDFTLFRFGHEMANDIVYLEMYSDTAYLDKRRRRSAATPTCSADFAGWHSARWSRDTGWRPWRTSTPRRRPRGVDRHDRTQRRRLGHGRVP